MHCPFCGANDTRVTDSRLVADGDQVRRRRQCASCQERFTTYETAELVMPRVVKSDGSRESFNEAKLRAGMLRALEKRPVSAEAIEAAVRLSHRYIPARQLPDKSVSLLDTAAARVAVSQYAIPAEVDDCRKHIQALETELKIIARESNVGIESSQRRDKAQSALTEAQERLVTLEERWTTEKDLVATILGLRAQLRDHNHSVEGTGSELEQQADDQVESEADSESTALTLDCLLYTSDAADE